MILILIINSVWLNWNFSEIKFRLHDNGMFWRKAIYYFRVILDNGSYVTEDIYFCVIIISHGKSHVKFDYSRFQIIKPVCLFVASWALYSILISKICVRSSLATPGSKQIDQDGSYLVTDTTTLSSIQRIIAVTWVTYSWPSESCGRGARPLLSVASSSASAMGPFSPIGWNGPKILNKGDVTRPCPFEATSIDRVDIHPYKYASLPWPVTWRRGMNRVRTSVRDEET